MENPEDHEGCCQFQVVLSSGEMKLATIWTDANIWHGSVDLAEAKMAKPVTKILLSNLPFLPLYDLWGQHRQPTSLLGFVIRPLFDMCTYFKHDHQLAG